MKIQIKVIANSKIQSVVQQPDGILKVRLKAKPLKGQANDELIKVLAEYYHVSRSDIEILKGQRLKSKLLEINN